MDKSSLMSTLAMRPEKLKSQHTRINAILVVLSGAPEKFLRSLALTLVMNYIARAGGFSPFLVELHERFGPIASFWMGKDFVVSIGGHEYVKDVCHLFDRPVSFFEAILPLTTDQTIQIANGPEGQARRKLHDQSFSHDKLVKQLPLFQEVGEELAKKWKTMAGTSQHVPLSSHMCNAVMKILSRYSFGDYFKDEKKLTEWRKTYDMAFGLLMEVMENGPFPSGSDKEKQMKEGVKQMRAIVSDLIKQRENSEVAPEDKVFIDALLDKYDNEDQVFADCMTYLIGGFHTTSFHLTWMLYFLATHKDIQEKCYQEIAKIYKGGPIEYSKFKDMKYVQQVMNESHRVSALAGFSARYSNQDLMVGGHKVTKNTPVLLAMPVLMFDERVWPDPQKLEMFANTSRFDPERFRDMSKIPNNALIPFGFPGKRKCPGYRMADYESQTILVILLSRFKISLVPGQVITRKDAFVTQPSDEIWVNIEERK